jgi:hypothetical protein
MAPPKRQLDPALADALPDLAQRAVAGRIGILAARMACGAPVQGLGRLLAGVAAPGPSQDPATPAAREVEVLAKVERLLAQAADAVLFPELAQPRFPQTAWRCQGPPGSSERAGPGSEDPDSTDPTVLLALAEALDGAGVALRARLLDQAWCLTHTRHAGGAAPSPEEDADLARRAVRAYLEAIRQAELPAEHGLTSLDLTQGLGLELPRVQGWLLRATQIAAEVGLPSSELALLESWLPSAVGAARRCGHPPCTLRAVSSCRAMGWSSSQGLVELAIDSAQLATFQAQFAWARALYASASQLLQDGGGQARARELTIERALCWAYEAQFRHGLRLPAGIVLELLQVSRAELEKLQAPPQAFARLERTRKEIAAASSALEIALEPLGNGLARCRIADRLLLTFGLACDGSATHFLAALPLESPALADLCGSPSGSPTFPTGGPFDPMGYGNARAAASCAFERELEACSFGATCFPCAAGEPPAQALDVPRWYRAAVDLGASVLEDLRLCLLESAGAARTELALLVQQAQHLFPGRSDLVESGLVACLQGDARGGLALLVPHLRAMLERGRWPSGGLEAAFWALLFHPQGPQLAERCHSGEPAFAHEQRGLGNLVFALLLRALSRAAPACAPAPPLRQADSLADSGAR